MTLRAFTATPPRVLPATAWGVRAAGDPDRVVRTVAVCGGSGAAQAGVGPHATARTCCSRPTSSTTRPSRRPAERGPDGIALVDAAHWATEAPWLDEVAARLRNHFGTSVDVSVSTHVTDPWTLHEPSAGKAPATQ